MSNSGWQKLSRHFEKAIELDSQFAAAYFHLAKSLQEQRKTALALGNLRKALELVPEHSAAARDIQNAIREFQEP